MGDQSQSFPGAGEAPELNHKIIDQIVAQRPEGEDPEPKVDKAGGGADGQAQVV